MKYYIYRVNLLTGRKEYKKAKTLDIYVSEAAKNLCWQYSKQGARNIIKTALERQKSKLEKFDYFLEMVPEK